VDGGHELHVTSRGRTVHAWRPREASIVPDLAPEAHCPGRHIACTAEDQVDGGHLKEGPVMRFRTAMVAMLLASFVALLPAPALADDEQRRGRRDRYEDRRDRYDDRRVARGQRYPPQPAYWDAARYYRRDDYRYPPRRMGRNDRIYRGSDNRYYCRRDDGTTGLIIGGMAGGVLGHVLAPGGSKTLGTIIGAGAGALLGRAVDQGDIVCR
jgi:hypothetical protein